MKLTNKTAIITGGARGIGLATAKKFLFEGANVVLVDINESNIIPISEELNEYKERLKFFIGDITDGSLVETAVSYAVEQFGTIDILVNNAGITADAQLLKMDEAQWDKVINVNLKGVFLMTQTVAKIMKEKEKGVILSASSIVGLYGNFGQTNYAASKFGINGMTKTWAKELGRYNIRVNSVAPGFIMTEMTKKMPENVLQYMKEKSVLKNLGKPEDIANAYTFLASDEASFITGSVLSVDGGAII
jgi:3-oxoacyl-[acyl-carrier protein] reductase